MVVPKRASVFPKRASVWWLSPSGLLLETLNSGGAAAESLLGRVVRNGLSQNGVGVRSMEFNVTPRGVNIQVSTK